MVGKWQKAKKMAERGNEGKMERVAVAQKKREKLAERQKEKWRKSCDGKDSAESA
jgi:hypothetical protein